MKKKIALYIEGGNLQSIISNIPTDELEIELIDMDNEEAEGTEDEAGDRWGELLKELPYANF